LNHVLENLRRKITTGFVCIILYKTDDEKNSSWSIHHDTAYNVVDNPKWLRPFIVFFFVVVIIVIVVGGDPCPESWTVQ
jgi:hypothetical protein